MRSRAKWTPKGLWGRSADGPARASGRFFRLAISVGIPFLMATCFLPRPLTSGFPKPPPPESLPAVPDGPSLNVLVLGDWGTGGEGQRALAEAMAATHSDDPPAFVLTVGDNFYQDGVQTTADSMWVTHFESVYEGPFWDRMPFHAILGNHDHRGEPDAQVEYSAVSARWTMPARYYAFDRPVPNEGSALFLALDTQPFNRRDTVAGQIQREWADSVLDESSHEWVVVGGHHPAVTGGRHDPNEDIQAAVWGLMAGRVDLYVSGHNHSTELLETAVGVPQAVCGGGGGLDNPYRVGETEETLDSFTNGGWCFLRIWPKVMAVDLHDRDGGIQYRHLIEK